MAESPLDLIIIGASAAGMSGAVYAARRRLNFKIIGSDIGGEMALSGEIENWPAVVHTTGIDLTEQFKAQMKANNVLIEDGVSVTSVKKESGLFVVTCKKNGMTMAADAQGTAAEGGSIEEHAKTVVVATGVHPRLLGIPGEKEFDRKGVSYCTVCDGPLFGGKAVATIGGGNSALESAIMMSEIATKVYLINKNTEFKGDTVMIEKIMGPLAQKNVEVITGAMTTNISGETMVKSLEYTDATGPHTISVDGIFVHIGMVPNSSFLGAEVTKDSFGNVVIDNVGRTSVEGLFAAGDVTNHPYHQLAIAAGQGVSATLTAVDYLNKMH